MSKGRRQRSVGAGVCAALTILATPALASAFEARTTSGGLPVHWADPNVSFVVDASVNAAAPGAAQVVGAATRAWSGNSGAPVLATSSGHGAAKPAIDGQNTILFAPNGYAAAGSALAITVLSFDDRTGDIVDADIVINGAHAFGILASGARAPAGTTAVSTEGTSGGDSDDSNSKHGQAPTFDLQHVVSHELGHALGLGDERDDVTALMYAYTMPNDASSRAPDSDDLAGVNQLYAASGTSPSQSSGCGGATIVGARIGSSDPWVIAALLAGAGVWLGSRRRLRKFGPCAAGLVVLLSAPSGPHSVAPTLTTVDARARVVAAKTTQREGFFETELELAPYSCRASRCPATMHARVWGGTMGGIIQQVGDQPAPRVADDVDLAFLGSPSAHAAEGAVLAVRPLKDH